MATVCDLVFEGGGAKGLAFVGALQELEARGFRPGRLVGTSAGAITAAVVAAGYDAAGLAQLSAERTADGQPRFATFLDPPAGFAQEVIEGSEVYGLLGTVSLVQILTRHIHIPAILTMGDERIRREVVEQLLRLAPARTLFSFVERGGLYEGSAFLAWIREKLNARGGLGDATLAEFHAATGRDLSVVVSDATAGAMLVLNHRTAPACPVAWAVRMSMSIPFLWQEVIWEPAWGTYAGRDLAGHSLVDGGVLSNFPLGLLTGDDPTAMAVMGAPPAGPVRTLGLLIDETLPVPGAGAGAAPAVISDAQAEVNRLRTVRRVRRLVDTVTTAHDQAVIAAHAGLVCRLPAQGYGTTEFDMNPARMAALIAAGRAALAAYLRNNP